jgi:fructose-1,6-bisphosphatase
MNCLANTAAGAGSKTSDDGHQRWLDEHPEKMRQRRETVELAGNVRVPSWP